MEKFNPFLLSVEQQRHVIGGGAGGGFPNLASVTADCGGGKEITCHGTNCSSHDKDADHIGSCLCTGPGSASEFQTCGK